MSVNRATRMLDPKSARFVPFAMKLLGYTKDEFCAHFGVKYPNRRSLGEEGLKRLIDEVNQFAEYAENLVDRPGEPSRFPERLSVARRYMGMNKSELAKMVGVSRESTRMWEDGVCRPGNIVQVASILEVPLNWLEYGGEEYLPANSRIGERVGEEQMKCRAELFRLTKKYLSRFVKNTRESLIIAATEHHVFTDKDFARLARRAGGRWHYFDEMIVWVPWRGEQKRVRVQGSLSPLVESIIEDAFSKYGSVGIRQVNDEIERQCAMYGVKPPSRITIYKRVGNEMKRYFKYGFSMLNGYIQECLEKENLRVPCDPWDKEMYAWHLREFDADMHKDQHKENALVTEL